MQQQETYALVNRLISLLVQFNQLGYYLSMEKSTPHCKLSVVQLLVKDGHVRATASAFNSARELGIYNLSGMCAVLLRLTPSDFYKSMTTHADHHIWQDVYQAKTAGGAQVYLKLTVIDDVLIVSFKEL